MGEVRLEILAPIWSRVNENEKKNRTKLKIKTFEKKKAGDMAGR